jgi:hypothetical protein
MSDIIELSELDFNDMNTGSLKSTNFGGGLELLMNDKVKKIQDKTLILIWMTLII